MNLLRPGSRPLRLREQARVVVGVITFPTMA